MGGISADNVTRLWDAHSAALVLYAQQWCAVPEDVVQEAFLLLVRQPVAPENPVGWLYRVVRHRALNAARSAGRAARREAAVASRGEPWFEPTMADQIDAAVATEALKQLPADQREVIVARVWGGLSFQDIAELAGTSVSTVYRSYQRGLATLRVRLRIACPSTNTEMTT
jgi:RNA polymerase sigma-70 factor (ECF subfamily)